MAFLLADDLNVASDATSEGVGLAERERERKNDDGVGAAECRAGASDRRAQNVRPRIALCHDAIRRRAIERNRGRGVAGAGCVRYTPDQAAGGAQFGDRREFIDVGGERDVDFRQGLRRRNAAQLGGSQIGDEAREHEREFLRFAGSGDVRDDAVGRHDLNAGRRHGCLHERDDARECRFHRLGQAPGPSRACREDRRRTSLGDRMP